VYGTFSSSHFLCTDALKGCQYIQSIVRVQRIIETITSIPSGSSPNIGAIVGGVVAGVVVGVALIWYLRRRSQQTSERGMFPFLESGSGSGANGKAPPSGAQTQELPGSHYYGPSGISSQGFYNSLPTSEALVPQPPPSSQTGYNLHACNAAKPIRGISRRDELKSCRIYYSFRVCDDQG
jgi:hypothetical protein